MSCISINLKKEETLVKIEDNATEEEIIGELKIKLAELTKLYQEEKTPIRVTGKILSEQELQDVRNIVKEYLDVQINFNTPTSLGLHSIVRSYKEKIENLLKECLKKDRTKTQVEGFTKLDLMELTRKHICSHKE